MIFKIEIENILDNGGTRREFKLPYDCRKVRRVFCVVEANASITVAPEMIVSYLSVILNNGDDMIISDMAILFMDSDFMEFPEMYPNQLDYMEAVKNSIHTNIPIDINASHSLVLKNSSGGDNIYENVSYGDNINITVYFDYDK